MNTVHKAKRIGEGVYEYRGQRIVKHVIRLGYWGQPTQKEIKCWLVLWDHNGRMDQWTTDLIESAKAEIDMKLKRIEGSKQ